MFTIDDLKLLDVFKGAKMSLNDEVNRIFFHEIIAYSLQDKNTSLESIPFVLSSSLSSQKNHIRLNLQNKGIKLLIILNDDHVEDLEDNFFSDQMSLIILSKGSIQSLQDILSELKIYQAEAYSRFENYKSQLSKNTSHLLNYADIINAYSGFTHDDTVLTLENNSVLHTNSHIFKNILHVEVMNPVFKNAPGATIFKAHVKSHDFSNLLSYWIKIPLVEQGSLQFIISSDKEITLSDYLIIDHTATLIRLCALEEIALENNKVRAINEVFDSILNGKHSSSEELLDYVAYLGLKEASYYRVLTVGFMDQKDNRLITNSEILEKLISFTIDQLQRVWPKLFFRIYQNRITFFIEDAFESLYDFQEAVTVKFDSTRDVLNRDEILIKIGVSEKSRVHDIHLYSTHSLETLKIAQLLISFDTLVFYENLGIYKLFIDLQQSNKLKSIIPPIVYEIANFNTDYLNTLKVFLDSNQNYSLSSNLLYIHSKTVRYRINNLTEKFNLRLNQPEEVLNLQMGLKAYELQQSSIIL